MNKLKTHYGSSSSSSSLNIKLDFLMIVVVDFNVVNVIIRKKMIKPIPKYQKKKKKSFVCFSLINTSSFYPLENRGDNFECNWIFDQPRRK